MAKTITVRGTTAEQKLFSEINGHYTLAKEDLDQRIQRKNGFNDADKMFSSYLDETSWPYQSLIFDPRPYTVILEKSARLIGSKPKGRLVPREGGDTLGAYINNELLSFQWEDNARLGENMISKWINMDQNARKYGSSFAIVKWRYETKVEKEEGKGKRAVFYDGPDFTVCNPRDVLGNPSYSFVNKWFQYREYLTIDELESVNDTAKGKPVYKNLDLLREAVKDSGKSKVGDARDVNYTTANKTIRGLTDYLGRDEVFKVVEIVTEYRPDRWITFAPRHGVVIRDIENPYKHSQIPVVQLKYYPFGDDLYGQSELEPVSRQVRAINAHVSSYVDRIALRLRPPVHVNPVNVRMHTLAWEPEAKWLMNNPNVDVQVMRMEAGEDQSFQSIYNVLVGSLLSALGENSQGVSTANPNTDAGQVTATEIKDSAFTRNVRDNMNMIFLSEALKKQIMFWHSMNQQFMFTGTSEKVRVIRIVGRDAVEFFNRQGLSDVRPTDEDMNMVNEGRAQYDDIVPGPRFPVQIGDGMDVSKFQPDESGEGGNLLIEEGDLLGNYDYIPDIESMKAPQSEQIEAKLMTMLQTITNPTILQLLAQKGRAPNVEEILKRAFEATNVIKDADVLFEDIQNGQPNLGGAIAPEAGIPTQGNGGMPGMERSVPPMASTPNPQLMGGSPQI